MQDPSLTNSVLVVEDNPGIRGLLVAVLRRAGFDVHAVADGAEAIQSLRSRSYGMAILDLVMPNVDGYAVLDRVAEFAPHFLSCILVVTAASPHALERHAYHDKVFKVLQKPFDLDELVSSVAHCVERGLVRRSEDPFLGIRVASQTANARAGVVGILDRLDGQLNLVWTFGYQEADLIPFHKIAVNNQTPMGTSILERRPVWVHSRSEVSSSYPTLLPILERRSTQALAAAPIVANEAVAGVIGWSFEKPQDFDERQKALLLRVVDEYGAALADRA